MSLQVALEVCKLVQAFYIERDALMYSWERDQLVKVQTASIVEDLGQVGYIFSDKTGTLTRNVMEFKYMVVGTEFYGDRKNFEQQADEEGEDEQALYIRKKTLQERKGSTVEDTETKEWKC